MIKYPVEFKKAQRDVDRICGSSRSPTAEDMDRLPFIKACMYEVFTDYFFGGLIPFF
jgi:hypothetical protein